MKPHIVKVSFLFYPDRFQWYVYAHRGARKPDAITNKRTKAYQLAKKMWNTQSRYLRFRRINGLYR